MYIVELHYVQVITLLISQSKHDVHNGLHEYVQSQSFNRFKNEPENIKLMSSGHCTMNIFGSKSGHFSNRIIVLQNSEKPSSIAKIVGK